MSGASSPLFVSGRHQAAHQAAQFSRYEFPAAPWIINTVFREVRGSEPQLAREPHRPGHDALTGLPDRGAVLGLLRQAMLQAAHQHQMVAVLRLDVDGFKGLKTRFGTHAGDMVLRQVAERLRGCIRACDSVCRYGAEGFVVLLTDIDHAADLRAAVRKIRDCLALQHAVAGRQIPVSASIGMALHREGASNGEALIHKAEVAMERSRMCVPPAR